MIHTWREMAWYVDVLWIVLVIAFAFLFLAVWLWTVCALPFVIARWSRAQNRHWWLVFSPTTSSQWVRDAIPGWCKETWKIWLPAVLFLILWSLASPTLCDKPGVKCTSHKGPRAADEVPAAERLAK